LALRLPQEALIDAAEALAALELALVQDGGSLLRERSVHSVVTTAGRVSGVDLNDGGHLAADLVVLAPGALGGPGLAEVCPALRRLTPAKGQLGVVHPRTDEVFGETLRTPSAYVVPGRLGELVFGATMEFGRLDFEEDQPALDSLFAHVRRILPGVRFDGPPAPYAVAVRPMSADWGPLVGPSGPEGLMVAAGHGRNGWLLAPATAQAISAYVFDDPVTPLWESFHPARFEAKAA
jgi:glycine oxidase